MSESKHTPGKWEVSGVTRVVVYGENGAAIAIICDPEFKSRYVSDGMKEADYSCKRLDEAAANAKLIAAAPDLLEGLKAITGAAQSWHDFHHGSQDVQCDSICEALPEAKAAIAKAEGKD